MKAHATRLLHLLLTTAILAATLLRVTPRKSPDDTAPGPVPSRTSEKTRARVDELRPHPRNPRRISPARLEQLQRTLEAEPEMLEARPLIALPDGTVVAGNQRLEAARRLGWETIPVVYADLGEDEVKRWMLLDNRPFGEDDREQAAALLAELEAAGGDLALTGYDRGEVEALLAELSKPRADPEAVPASPRAPRSVCGRVYELGRHRLMCGDATDPGHVAELVDAETAHAVVTDPPYGIDHEGVANDDPHGLRVLFDQMLAVAPIRDAVVVAFQSPRLVAVWLDAVRDAGHSLERLLWLHRQAAKTFPWRGWVLASDAIAVSSVGSPAWPLPSDFCHDTYVKTELEDSSLTGKHTTIKPAWVVRDLLSKLPAGVVYEPFAGSGTTLIAAESLGRRCLAMEIDPGYCDVIRQRYADYTGRPELAP